MDREAIVADIAADDEDWDGWLDREPSIDWSQYIHQDPDILVGKPVVKGTRLSVGFLLDVCAAGWTREQIFDSYPHLTPEALRAVFAFAADSVRTQYPVVWPRRAP